MLKIAILGIGNAGNQVADLGKSLYNIEGLAINSSEKDISTITSVEGIVIGDEKGAGKDRNIAKTFIQTHVKELLEQEAFTNVIKPNEVIFIVSSTGGGTGSGMAPVLRDLLSRVYPNKQFILVGILPPLKESIAAQQNTIDYLKEMRKTNPVYALYDNNKFDVISTPYMMSTVNREIIEDIIAIRGDYQHTTPFNSIDEKDMTKIIETRGRLVVSRVTGMNEKSIDEKSIEQRLIDTLRNSAHAELERDYIVKRLGLITNLNEKVYGTLDSNLAAFKDYVGEPIEGFEHVYINKEKEENRTIAIMSGLSVPDDRIEKILQRIEEVTDQINKIKESSILDDASIDFIDDLRKNKSETNSIDSIGIDDLFKEYSK
jgi:cell division GTPase FtsZ